MMVNTYKVVVTFTGGRAFTTNVLLPDVGLSGETEISLAETIGVSRIYKQNGISMMVEPDQVETMYVPNPTR